VIPEVRTERLLLRGWTDADRPAFAAINADPVVMETIGPLLSREESDAFVDRIVAHWAEHGYGLWCVDLDGECIGFTGLATPGFMPGVEVGWRLASTRWGNGYAPEAARAAVAFGFDVVGLDEIVSFTWVGNRNSRRVMDKLGMTQDVDGGFDHPRAPPRLNPHVLYRLSHPSV
jgi:RimJ/RimL family protein N-acetyltransferase